MKEEIKNAFGLKVYEIKEVLKDKKVKNAINLMLLPVLKYFGVPSKKANEIIKECLRIAETYSKLSEYEETAHSILEKERVASRIPDKLTARARLIYKQINPYVLNGKLLDYGCGDGKVGELIANSNKKINVILTDIYKHNHVKDTMLKFKLFKQGKNSPFKDNEFNTILVLTVYHHSSNPFQSIKDSYRLAKPQGRVLIIESVYGVTGKELSQKEKTKAKSYLLLNKEQQRMTNIFFDHFYNRVIHYNKNPKKKVNVPFNFNTPENWKKIFEKQGFKQEKVIHLGIDQSAVPEYHTLHILVKN